MSGVAARPATERVEPTERALIIVRHGRTAANANGLLLGRGDPPLDERGRAEADALGRTIASGRFGRIAAVVSSPLLRTHETATAITERTNAKRPDSAGAAGESPASGRSALTVLVDDRFIELDYGTFEGAAVASIDAATWRRWRTDPEFAPPGGESLAALGERVRDACTDWASRPLGPGNVVIVSHVSPIKAAVAWALGVADEVAWRTHLDTASVTRVICRRPSPALTLFNDTSHLYDTAAIRQEP